MARCTQSINGNDDVLRCLIVICAGFVPRMHDLRVQEIKLLTFVYVPRSRDLYILVCLLAIV
jgi:hypothetical protein